MSIQPPKEAGTAITYNEKALAFQQDKLETGTKAMELMRQKLHGTAGEYAKTAQGGMAQFKAQLGNLEEGIGKGLLPVVKDLTDFLKRLTGWFSGLSPETKKLIGYIVLGVAAFAGLSVAIGGVMMVLGPLITAIGFLAANPIVLAIAAVAALAGAIALAGLAPDKLKAGLEKMGMSATTAGKVVGDLRKVFEVVKTAGGVLVTAIRDHWSTIKAIFVGAFNIIRTTVTTGVEIIKSVWANFGSTLVSVLKIEWNYIKGTVKNGLEVIKGIFEVIDGLIHGNWSEVWRGIKNIVGGALKQIGNMMTTAASLLGAAAKLIGKAIMHGIIDPIVQLASAVYNEAVKVGQQIAHGIEHGFTSLIGSMGHSMASAAHSVVKSIKGAFGIHSPSKVMADEVGGPLAEGVLAGWIMGMPNLTTKMVSSLKGAAAKAATAAKEIATKLTAAWSKMTKDALSAMDKQIANWVSPAAKLLAKMQGADTKNSLTGAVSDAQSALSDAQNGTPQTAEAAQLASMQAADQLGSYNDAIAQAQTDLSTALASGDQAGADAAQTALDAANRALQEYNLQQTVDAQNAAAAKQTAVLAAEQQLADAKRALQEYNLGVDDAAETAAHTKAVKKAEAQFKEKMATLEKQLLKEHATRKKALKDLKALYAKYDVPYSAGEVAAAAALIATAVKAITGKSTTKAKKMASGGIVTTPTYALVGEAGPEAVIPLSSMGRGGNTYNITLPLGNVWGDPKQAARAIQRELAGLVKSGGMTNYSGGYA